MEDHQCHRNNNRRRQTLMLPKTVDLFSTWARIDDAREGMDDKQRKLREHSRRLAEERQQRRVLANERQQLRERQQQLERERSERQHQAEQLRLERERIEAENQRRRWHELLKFAVEVLGLEPQPFWDPKVTGPLLEEKRRAWLVREERRAKAAEERSVRYAKLSRLARECAEDEWDHVPHVVKFGDFDRGLKAWYFRGDLKSHNQDWLCRGRHRVYQARMVAEAIGQQPKPSYYLGRGPRPPQKQPRTWKAKTPRRWRRKDQCASRWDHLFD